MKDYLADAISAEDAVKQKDKFPIRAAAAKAMIAMREVWKATGAESGGLRESFVGEATDAVKKSIENREQGPVARIDVELRDIIDHLRGLKKDRILKKIQKLARSGMW